MLESPMGSIYVADELPHIKPEPLWNETESEQPRHARPRVLVVDDQKLIADTIAEILEGAGFHALAAYDGWTALEAAPAFKPDYLLTDVLMPRMNGVQLAIAIRRNYPGVRILLFSGQAGTTELMHESRKQGYDFELIAKPIHPLKLIEHLKNEPK
jgi:CheY-like chemotaxis protein